MSTNFQAIVVRPSLPRAFGKDGLDAQLKVWMPPVGNLDLTRLEALQGAFRDELEIVPKAREGRVLIIQKIHAFAGNQVTNAARKLAFEIDRHLGIPATIQ